MSQPDTESLLPTETFSTPDKTLVFKRCSKFRFFSIDSKSEDLVLQKVFKIPLFRNDFKSWYFVLEKVLKFRFLVKLKKLRRWSSNGLRNSVFLVLIQKVKTVFFKRCSIFRFFSIDSKSWDHDLQKVFRIPLFIITILKLRPRSSKGVQNSVIY